VIERVANEKLQVAIDRAFAIMSRGAMLPPPPPALHGREVRVEFVSILQQMQRMVGIGQIERVVGFVGNLAAAHPDVLDKIDFDEALDEYAWRAGTRRGSCARRPMWHTCARSGTGSPGRAGRRADQPDGAGDEGCSGSRRAAFTGRRGR
jgi:hypothetical protein